MSYVNYISIKVKKEVAASPGSFLPSCRGQSGTLPPHLTHTVCVCVCVCVCVACSEHRKIGFQCVVSSLPKDSMEHML